MHSHPVDNAGFLSYMTFAWLTPLVWKIFKNSLLNEEDLWKASPCETSELNSKRFQKLWQKELRKHGKQNASILRVIWHFCRARCLLAIAFLIISMATSFCYPVFLIRRFLLYSNNVESNTKNGFLLVLGSFILQICQAWFLGLVSAINYRTGARLKAAVLSLSFKKVLQLWSSRNVDVGKLINMCTTDIQYICDMPAVGCTLTCILLITLVGVIYTIIFLGPAAFIALVIFIVISPSMLVASRLEANLRKKCASMTDRRVQKMTELLNYIEFVKMYTWEKPCSEKIKDIQDKEHELLEKAVFAQGMIGETASVLSIIATVTTITLHMAVGYSLNAAEAFTVVAVFTSMTDFLKVLPSSVKVLSEASLCITRFQTLFLMEEWKSLKPKPENQENAIEFRRATLALMKRTNTSLSANSESTKQNMKKKQVRIFFPKRTAAVNSETDVEERLLEEEHETEYQTGEVQNPDGTLIINDNQKCHHQKTLFNIDLNLQKGKLIGICGKTGSGKSSLILAILGQMQLMEGSLTVDGSFAYSAQQAWILNMSVRENILFGKDYNEVKYQEVLKACCLQVDISNLPQKDMTEIRDQGTTLSKGQRHRISLARALYSDRDILLLDDPLSAVDAITGRHLFNNAIKKSLKEKTVVLVTNQLQHLIECDEVIFMKNGSVAEHGTHEDLMRLNGDYAMLFGSELEMNFIHQHMTIGSQEASEIVSSLHLSKSNSKMDHFNKKGQQMQTKRKATQLLSWSVCKSYIMAAGGLPIFLVNIVLFGLTTCSIFLCTFWLTYWINQGSGCTSIVMGNDVFCDSMSDNPQKHVYEGICILLLATMVLMRTLRGLVFFKCAITASSKLHDQAFEKVIKSPVKFFDTVPLSTILQNFTKIIDVDSYVGPQAEVLLQNIALIIVCVVDLAATFPWLLSFVLPVALLFWAMHKIASMLVGELWRLNRNTQAPIMSLVTCTLHGDGIATIHAYGQSGHFLNRFHQLLDKNQSASYLLTCGMHWLSIRLDEISTLLMACISLLIVYKHGHIAGLGLSYAMQLTGLFHQTILLVYHSETKCMSVGKIINYIQELELESQQTEEVSPLPDWPQGGQIRFEGVEMRYHDDLPLALKKISFETKPQEKIRIVGRTGSGKSSLGETLFRLAELNNGSIFVDGVDISKIPVNDLRPKLTFIPQNPVLFRGTVRFNLDPLDQYDDWQIWEALERTYMKDNISQLPLKLLSEVQENGENFSIGERQLLCITRALLRHSKILFLDEATSSFDNKTELLIQLAISEEFSDCTTLIISQRLNTVLNCDRIMVLEEGQIAEFDIPSVLLSREDSLFRALVVADIVNVSSND